MYFLLSNFFPVLAPDRANDVGRVLRFFQELRGDNDVHVDSPEREPQFSRNGFAPSGRLPDGILVTDHQSGIHVFTKFQEAVIGEAAENQSNAAFLEGSDDVRNALCEKRIVTEIGGRERTRSEEDYDRLTQCIRGFHGYVECGGVDAALGALHPVNDAGPIRVRRPRPPDSHPGIVS